MRLHGGSHIGLFGAIGLLAGTLVAIASRNGLKISVDSTYYLAGAQGLAEGDGIVGLDGRPMSLYPPGLPVLLAVLNWFGDPVEAARWLNVLLLGVSVVAVGAFLARRVRPWLAAAAAAALAVSPQLIDVHTWLWSEPAFIALSLAYLMLLVRLAERERASVRLIALAGLLAATATLVRYSGISLLPVAALVLLGRRLPWATRTRDLMAFGAAYAVPVGLWLLRNTHTTGEITGERAASSRSLSQVATDAAKGFAAWIAPQSAPQLIEWLLVLAAVAVVAAVTWAVVRGNGHNLLDRCVVVVFLGYLVLGFLVLYATTVRSNVDPLSGRLLAPLLPAALLALAAGLDITLDRLGGRAGATVAGLAGLLVVVNAAIVLPGQVSARHGGALALNSPQSDNASTRRLADSVPHGALVASNRPWLFSYLRPGSAVEESPRRTYYASSERPNDLPGLAAQLTDGPVYLVWFQTSDDYHLSPSDLRGEVLLHEQERTSAGVVYVVTSMG